MIVDEHTSTAKRSHMRFTLLVSPQGHATTTLLRHAGVVAVPGPDGHQLSPDTVCYRDLFHPNTIYSRVPLAETHW
jgi:hypothetical protein